MSLTPHPRPERLTSIRRVEDKLKRITEDHWQEVCNGLQLLVYLLKVSRNYVGNSTNMIH
jgi:hypothetical protein